MASAVVNATGSIIPQPRLRFFHVEKRPVWIWEENNMFLEDYEVQLSLEQDFLSKSTTVKIYVSVV